MKPFELKIVFIDGKYTIIENVTNYSLDRQARTYDLTISDSNRFIFVNADQVRLIGLATDLEDVLF